MGVFTGVVFLVVIARVFGNDISCCIQNSEDIDGIEEEVVHYLTPDDPHEYLFVSCLKTWDEALQHCEDWEGNLLYISSKQENGWIDFMVRQRWGEVTNTPIWIGLEQGQCYNSIYNNPNWKFTGAESDSVDPNSQTYIGLWAAEVIPRCNDGANCGHMHLHLWWNTAPCHTPFRSICKRSSG